MQFGLIVANQNKKKLKRGHYTFTKCSILGTPRKKQ